MKLEDLVLILLGNQEPEEYHYESQYKPMKCETKFYSMTAKNGTNYSVTETPFGYTIFNKDGTKEFFK